MKLLILGFGSVGKKYLSSNSDYADIYVFDPYINVEPYKDIKFLTKEDLAKSQDKSFDGVVICDYASTRLESLKQTYRLARNFIILEKIITDKKSDLETFKSIQKKCAPIYTHHRWGLLNLEDEIHGLVGRFGLGAMRKFSSVAGNCCLSTGGSHWIAFYLSLLKKINDYDLSGMEIFARLFFSPENPRSQALNIVSGSISITNKLESLDCDITYVAKSHVAPVQSLMCEFGYIEWGLDGKVSVYKIKQDVGTLKPWSYGVANEVYAGSLHSMADDPFKKCIELASLGEGINLHEGIDVATLLLGACISNAEKNSIKISEFYDEKYAAYSDKSWGIT